MLQNLPSQVLQNSMSRRSAEIEMDTIQHVALSGDQQPGVRCWPVAAVAEWVLCATHSGGSRHDDLQLRRSAESIRCVSDESFGFVFPCRGLIVRHGSIQEQTHPVRLQRCPEYRDPWALLEHGIAAIVRLSQCDDPAIAMEAEQWLVEYGKDSVKRKSRGKASRVTKISQ